MSARRGWRWLALILVAGLGMALLASLWLARSEGGRDWLLARAIATLPAGAQLDWDRAAGSLSGPLEIHGLRYAHEGTRFQARRVRIDHAFWPLLSGRLDIRTLTVEGAVLVLPPDEEPAQLPPWPELLPRLELPLTIAIADLQVRGLEIRRGDDPLLVVARIDGGLTASRGALALRGLRASGPWGQAELDGEYRPTDGFRSDVAGQLQLAGVDGAPPVAVGLRLRGDLDLLLLRVEARAPSPTLLRLRLRDGAGATPTWQLLASSDGLEPARLGLADAASYAFALRVDGKTGEAIVQGRLSRDDLAATVLPSRLRVDAGVLALAPLSLRLPQGALHATGTVALAGTETPFDLRLRSPGLLLQPASGEPGAQAVAASGELRLQGRWSDWTVAGQLGLQRGQDAASLTLAGRGDADQLRMQSIEARMPSGRLQGSGAVRWRPGLQLALDARLAGFDPGYFLPDYPGSVSGAVTGQAARDAEGRWQGEARLAGLRGTLRGRPLQADSQLRFANGSGEGELALRLGDSRVTASGRFGERLDLQARFAPLALADLWPNAAGRLQGSARVHGPRAAPSYALDLRGDQLLWNGLAAATLVADGQLPGTGTGGALRLRAGGVSWQGTDFDAAALDVTGSLADLRAQLELAGDSGRVQVTATAAGSGDRWRGRIEQLQLAPPRGVAWRLRAPASYRLAAGSLQLERACLVPAAGGGALCAEAVGSRASASGQALPLALLEPWLADSALGLQPFGVLDLDGAFERQRDGQWTGNAQLRSARGGLRIDPQSPRELLAYSDLRLELRLQPAGMTAALQAGLAEGGSLRGQWRSTGLAGDSTVQGDLDLDVRQLRWLELLSPELAAPAGHLTGRLSFGGRLDAPGISGNARLAGFTAELPGLGVELRAGEFALRGEADGQARITGQVSSGAGQLQVAGSLNLRDRQSPLEVTLRGADITVADTPELAATMSPDLRLRYDKGVLAIRGEVLVPSARIDLEELETSVAPSPDVVVLDPRETGVRAALLVDTDIVLRLGDAVHLRGFGLDGRLGGRLRVRDPPGASGRATGTLDIAGSYDAYGRELQITRGRLSYLNAPYDNPTLDILAEHEFEDLTVGVQVRGSALAPVTTVSSNPPLATAEALSWLVLGRPLSSASGSESQRINASALALSAGSSLLAQRLGTRLGLDDAGIVENRALGGSILQLGKQVSPRLFVSYGLSLIGTGQVITLKYLLTRGLNVSVESGTVETAASLNWRREK